MAQVEQPLQSIPSSFYANAWKKEFKTREPVEGFGDEISRIVNNLEDKQDALDDMEDSDQSDCCLC